MISPDLPEQLFRDLVDAPLISSAPSIGWEHRLYQPRRSAFTVSTGYAARSSADDLNDALRGADAALSESKRMQKLAR